MKILHRAKEKDPHQWVYGLFTGTNEFIVIGDEAPRIAIVDVDTIGCYIGKNCLESKRPIFEGDIVKDYKGDTYIIVYDDYDCAFKLKSSLIYSGTRPINGSLTLIGNIIDDDFPEPEQKNEPTSKTPTSESSQRRRHKEAMRGIGK